MGAEVENHFVADRTLCNFEGKGDAAPAGGSKDIRSRMVFPWPWYAAKYGLVESKAEHPAR